MALLNALLIHESHGNKSHKNFQVIVHILIIHPHKENVLPEADQVYLSPSYTDWK